MGSRLRWRCLACDEVFRAWAKAERHADAEHSPGCVLELEYAEV